MKDCDEKGINGELAWELFLGLFPKELRREKVCATRAHAHKMGHSQNSRRVHVVSMGRSRHGTSTRKKGIGSKVNIKRQKWNKNCKTGKRWGQRTTIPPGEPHRRPVWDRLQINTPKPVWQRVQFKARKPPVWDRLVRFGGTGRDGGGASAAGPASSSHSQQQRHLLEVCESYACVRDRYLCGNCGATDLESYEALATHNCPLLVKQEEDLFTLPAPLMQQRIRESTQFLKLEYTLRPTRKTRAARCQLQAALAKIAQRHQQRWHGHALAKSHLAGSCKLCVWYRTRVPVA
eukprot:Clim_evm29s34 gene=Clim_evmTU29s34